MKLSPEDITKAEEVLGKGISQLDKELPKDMSLIDSFVYTTGLPQDIVPKLVEYCALVRNYDISDVSKAAANTMFDLVIVAAAIGYMHGKRQQATPETKAASDPS